MSFGALKQRMADAAFEKFGMDGVYQSILTGQTLKVRVIVKRNFESNPGVLLTGISEKITAIDLLYRQVCDPRVGDTINVDGQKFTVDGEIENDHIKVRVSVK